MRSSSFIFLCAGIISTVPVIAQTSVYASPYCSSGCQAINDRGIFYTGPTLRNYRVCTADGYKALVDVDGRSVVVPSTDRNNNSRGCVDVSGKQLSLTDGAIIVGLLP